MATIPIKVSDAKQLATREKLKRCVIWYQLEDGRVGYASYGKTRDLCQSTRLIMDDVFDDVEYRMQGCE